MNNKEWGIFFENLNLKNKWKPWRGIDETDKNPILDMYCDDLNRAVRLIEFEKEDKKDPLFGTWCDRCGPDDDILELVISTTTEQEALRMIGEIIKAWDFI